MNPTTEKPTVLRPPTKQSSIPIPRDQHIEEAPQGAPAQHPSLKPKPVCLDCSVETMPNGEGIATIIIPPDVMKRLKMRSQGLTVDEYLWSFVVKPALYSAVY